MAREERRKQRDLRRQQQEEATNRRRGGTSWALARGQADLLLRQAKLATLRPEEFVSQNAPAPSGAIPQYSEINPQEAVSTPAQ
ncbi:MAG: hypothetical protein KIT83_18445 [Bryobacterales bacterium]|nr:hypothetical protein [Bryobacterales bacterium]